MTSTHFCLNCLAFLSVSVTIRSCSVSKNKTRTKHWSYLYGIYVHGNLYIFVAQVQVIFITSTIAGQNYLLTRISLKKHWGSHKLPSWNTFTNFCWLQSQNVHTSLRTQRIVVTVTGDSHGALNDYLEVIITCPVASGKNALLSPPGSVPVITTDKHQQPGTGIGGPPEGGSSKNFKWVAAGWQRKIGSLANALKVQGYEDAVYQLELHFRGAASLWSKLLSVDCINPEDGSN